MLLLFYSRASCDVCVDGGTGTAWPDVGCDRCAGDWQALLAVRLWCPRSGVALRVSVVLRGSMWDTGVQGAVSWPRLVVRGMYVYRYVKHT